jgi:alanine racemase
MTGAAHITVRTASLAANFQAFRSLAGTVPVAAVVKADAYGLGLAGVLPSLSCDTFFVARLSEAVALRALQPQARIFVLDGAQAETIPALIAHRLIPVLGNLAEIAGWQAAARGHEAALHVDTGMNRLGLPPEELSRLAAEAKTRLAGIPLALVMSHLAFGEDPAAAMNATQLSRFRAALAALPPAPASLAASGGILLGRDYHFDLVRPGIGLYGGAPHTGHPNPMQPVVSLTAPILQLRRIAPGDSVGYCATFRAARESLIATIPLGYADGVLRTASGRAAAMVRGRRVPVVGRVSMDLITLDVTGLPDVETGDEAELLGPSLPVDEVAESWGTISYEVLTGLSRRIPRVYEEA